MRAGTVTIARGRTFSVWVCTLGLACCAVEACVAALQHPQELPAGVLPAVDAAEEADVLVVSGTVTDKMAPAVRRLYAQLRPPGYVVSFGACSNSGGPYWDSYSVTKGVDTLVPVDVYVPGCPPRPQALLDGLTRLAAQIDAVRDTAGGVPA